MPNKLIVDQIAVPGGIALSFPTADGANNQVIKTDGSGNLGFITLTTIAAPTDNIAPADGVTLFGSVVTSSARQNGVANESWTTSGPWTTYTNENATGGSASYTTQAWNMFLGDGYPDGTSELTYSGDFIGHPQRQMQFANNNRTGWSKMQHYYKNSTSYSGVTWRVMPIRNTTASPITRTVYFNYSSYGSYSGSSCGYFTPSGTGTLYSQQTGGSWTQGFSTTGNVDNTASSISVVVPANTTILVMLVTAHRYYTTYQFPDTNEFYGLSSLFTSGLVCDMKMLYALQYCRSPSNNYANAVPHQIYNACAESFGDR
jgi:hypothetical protein